MDYCDNGMFVFWAMICLNTYGFGMAQITFTNDVHPANTM